MVLLKLRCNPEDIKATIAVTFSASNLSLSSDPALRLTIHLRILESTQDQPSPYVPIAQYVLLKKTWYPRVYSGGGLRSTSNPNRRISLGMLRPHYARSSESPPVNLRERNLEWVTIPATGLTGGETEVTHELSMSRLVAHAADTVKEGGGELKTGERFKMHMSDGYIGTSWWCWGDLEGDLRDKPFHAWQKGINFLGAPFPADPDSWALGEDPSELKFEDHSGWVECKVVEWFNPQTTEDI